MIPFFKRNLSGISFALAIIIILAANSAIYFRFRSLIESDRKVNRTIETQGTLNLILILLNELETGPRLYLITGEEHYLDPYLSAAAPDGLKRHLRKLHQLCDEDSVQQRNMATLDSLVTKKILFLQTLVSLQKQRGFDAAKAWAATDVGNRTMSEIRPLIETMKQREGVLLQQQSSSAVADLQNMVTAILSGGTLSLLLFLLSFSIANREVGARKQESEKLRQLNNELDQRVASRTASLLDYTEKLRVSEEHFRLMVDGVKDYAIFMLDPQGVVISWNNGAEKLKGYKAEEIIGQHMSIFYADEDKKSGKPARLFQRAVSEGRVKDTGWRVRKDGSRFIANVIITAIYDGNHQLIGFTKVTRDITRRTENELKISRLSSMYSTLAQVNEVIVHVKEQDELLKTICHVVVEYGKFELAWIGLYDHETGLVTPACADSKEQGSVTPSAINIKEAAGNKGIIASAVESGNVTCCKNIQTDPAMQECCREVCSLGFHSAAAVPVRQNGVIVAVINLYSTHVEYFDPDELHLLEEIGRDISFALDTMDMEKRQKEGKVALQKSERQFREMFEGNIAVILIFDPVTLSIIDANRSAADFYGWTREELRHMRLPDINTLPPEDMKDKVQRAVSGEQRHFISCHRRADGLTRYVEVFATRIGVGDTPLIYAIINDITDRQQFEQANAFHLSILEMVSLKTVKELMQMTIDEAERLTGSSIGFMHYVNENDMTLSLQGFSTNTLKNMCKVAIPDDHYPINTAGIWADAVRRRRAVIHNDYASIKDRKGMPEGHAEIWREAVVPVFRNDKVVALIGVGNKLIDYNENDTKIVSMLGNVAWDVIAKKITDDEHKLLELQHYIIENLAMHDSLTGLPNRRLLSDRLSLAIAQCRRNTTRAALFILDLDRFKTVNDTLGHQIGDLFLKEVASRMLGVLRRSGDTIARIGGDEYVVLLPQIAALPDAVCIAEKIRNVMLQPFDIEGHGINSTCSIGIALFPDHGEDERTLMKHADEAMYQAKREGRNRITVFSAAAD